MPSILFVCTANQFRSPIAAAYFRGLLQRHGVSGWQVHSAGTWTPVPRTLMKDAQRAAAALRLDLDGHLSRLVDKALLAASDLILVMEIGQKEALTTEFPEARERVFLLSEMLNGVPFDIPDPARSPGDANQTLQEMCDVIQRGLPRITELATAHAGSRS